MFYLAVFCFGTLFTSCASKKKNEFQEIDTAVEKSDFQAGIENVRRGQEGRRPRYHARNAVSLFLDKGLLEYYAGEYHDSSESLQRAEQLIQEAQTKSISENFLSYIANDNTKEYPGVDFENLYINVFNALNYYNRGELDGALVEIRKLTMTGSGKLYLLGRQEEGAKRNVVADAVTELAKLGFTDFPELPESKPVNFSDSALVRYLSALFYLGDRNMDSARIEFELINGAFASNPNIYSFPMPNAVEAARNVPAGATRLNIIGFTGLSPIKEEQKFNQIFPIFQNKVLWYPEFKLPVMVKRPSRIDRVEIVVGNEKFDLELLEDMGAIVEETYNATFTTIFLKTYIRTLLKYAAVDIAAELARQNAPNEMLALAAVAGALGAKATFDASERADLRMARYLPDRALIGGINLEPGSHTVQVHYYSGNFLIDQEVHTVNVRPNALNLIQVVNLK